MNQHELAAYGTLHETANKLRAITIGALSSSHPLTLGDETVALLVEAVNAIHAAQRKMETTP